LLILPQLNCHEAQTPSLSMSRIVTTPAIEMFGILMMVILGLLGLLDPMLMIRFFILCGV
jgi:hypothetical protein